MVMTVGSIEERPLLDLEYWVTRHGGVWIRLEAVPSMGRPEEESFKWYPQGWRRCLDEGIPHEGLRQVQRELKEFMDGTREGEENETWLLGGEELRTGKASSRLWKSGLRPRGREKK